jgi:hemoglobin-like flavoprotein
MTYFYGRLFAAEPGISAMFPAAMDGQRHRFYRALYRIVVTKDEGLGDYLAELGRAHRKSGVRKQHYEAFRTALLAAAYRFTPCGRSGPIPRSCVTACRERRRGACRVSRVRSG